MFVSALFAGRGANHSRRVTRGIHTVLIRVRAVSDARARWGGLPGPFWVALLLLALNDHLLKGGGRVPAVLTGKLSDFAGLIVAPLLLCALLRVGTRSGRALVFASIAVPFAALKLSPACAAGAAGLLTACGLPSRIVCDPSDLIAFAVLPWAWRLASRLRAPSAGQRAWLRRFGLAAAALACTATSMFSAAATLR
jgi:hypothetical protein